MSIFLIVIGILGLAASTLLFPISAFFIFRRIKPKNQIPFEPPLHVLIPAHNEEKYLPVTIKSIYEAAQQAQVAIEITVGLDNCSDASKKIALEHNCKIVETVGTAVGKWAMLGMLSKSIESNRKDGEWICFVDCGTVWPKSILSEVLSFCSRGEVIAIAPRYTCKKSLVADLLWKIERLAKELESTSYSLLSVHGATIFYRLNHFQTAYSSLASDQAWLTEDIAVPIALLTNVPDSRIHYLKESNLEDKSPGEEVTSKRRRRLVFGNLRWFIELYPDLLKRNPRAALLLLRRVCRIFWAYWFLLVCAGIFLAYPLIMSAGTVIIFAVFAVRKPVLLLDLLRAAQYSLLAPYYLLSGTYKNGTNWS